MTRFFVIIDFESISLIKVRLVSISIDNIGEEKLVFFVFNQS